MSRVLSDQEKQEIQTIVNYFYKGSLKLHNINEKVADIVYQMLQYAQSCSVAMNLVPRPAGMKPGISYVLKEIAKITLRLKKDNKIYHSCRDSVALKWRTALTLADLGI